MESKIMSLLVEHGSWLSSEEIREKLNLPGNERTIRNKTQEVLKSLERYNYVERKKLTTDWERKIYGNTYIYKVTDQGKESWNE